MPASPDLGMWRKVAHPWLPAYNIKIWNMGINPNCYTKFERLARLADSEVLVSAIPNSMPYCPSR